MAFSPPPLILASGSATRRRLLERAGVPHQAVPAQIDEEALRLSLVAEMSLTPRDQAQALALAKARKIAQKHPEGFVLGADQILALGTRVFHKPETPEAALEDLRALSGQMHHLYSALVLFEDGKRVWQHIGTAHLTMRVLGEAEMAAYVAREWERIRHCVGGYQIEGAGIQLFQEILGDYFTVLGLPLLPLLLYLRSRGFWGDA